MNAIQDSKTDSDTPGESQPETGQSLLYLLISIRERRVKHRRVRRFKGGSGYFKKLENRFQSMPRGAKAYNSRAGSKKIERRICNSNP
eukprot:1392465-Amorphochlora_amoeboformis.AAC.1